MYILGISSFYHDSAAVLIKDGKIIAAAQEERFTRIKHDESFPINAINYCLKEASIEISDIDHLTYYENTHLKFDRIVSTYLKYLPKSFRMFNKAISFWLHEKINLENDICKFLDFKKERHSVYHHLTHAASAFYPSGLKDAAILIADGVGEWACTSIGIGDKNGVQILKEIRYPHSLGMLYSAFTQYVGFRVNSGEYKLMGLAPYGKPKYYQKILDNLIDLKEDGSYKLNLRYFDFHHGFSTINKHFEKLFGAPRRVPECKIRELDQDLAASIQKVFNENLLRLAKIAKELTGSDNLVIAGGVGLNCVSNGHIAMQKIFHKVWVQPAAGDAGGALGSALYTYYDILKQKRNDNVSTQGSSLLGPSFSKREVQHYLDMFGIEYTKIDDEKKLYDEIVSLLANEKIIGLFQGRMEFGPRALGSRSIIGDPRSEKMQREMNLRIKFRESFRPFAPAVMKEHASKYFDMDYYSPYMLFVVPVKEDKRLSVDDENTNGLDKLYQKRSILPAITHVDYSARVQTVDKDENPLFYKVLENFYKKTSCPVLINTSFNVRGEPIVCSPIDAMKCFFSNEIDALVMNNYIVYKTDQNYEKIGHLYRNPEIMTLEEARLNYESII